MRVLAVLFAIVSLAGGEHASAVGTMNVPVLVELFTSEGCSSCPPADAFLQRLDSIQPVPGAYLIILSEHVDYWDHDGWKDPFSSHALTDRQTDYARKLGLATVYTPQIIVDGTRELRLNDPKEVNQVFQTAAETKTIPVQIGPVTTDGSNPGVARVHVQADGTSAEKDADIYLALALDHAESQVLRGENSGRRLSYVAVVQSLTKLGKLRKGEKFDQNVEMKLHSGTDPTNLRLIVFLQDSGPGEVVGAASEKVSAEKPH